MNPYLFPGLSLSPRAIDRIFRQIPQSDWDRRIGDRFTPREAIAHLADWEPILLERMQRSRQQPGAVLQGQDEGELAEQKGYASLDPLEQLELFRAARERTSAWLETLQEEDWSKAGLHSERGPQTVYDQANLLLGHDLYHIEHLTQYLK